MTTEVLDIAATPIGFVESILGLPLYPWQDKALAPLEHAGYGKKIVQVTVLAPNEGGKSSRIVAGSACYWISVFERGTVAITTKDSKQLNEQIIPAIEEQISRFEGWKSVKSPYYKVTTATGGRIVAYTTDDAGRVEGFHGKDPDAPLLYIVDEAKSVDEKIFEGIDRCGYQALIYCSSGGLEVGTFYNSHFGKKSDFVKVRAGLKDCPHISPEKVQRMIKKYGENHPLVRSSVYGEFMAQGDTADYCINARALNSALLNPPRHRVGQNLLGFCDFGAGTAEHVLAVRSGNKVEIAAAWIEADPDKTAGRFIREFIKAGFKQDTAFEFIACDASDKEIWQAMADAGWKVRRQNFGAPPQLVDEYQSWSAEIWIEGGLKIARGDWIIPDDDILKSQLVSRKKIITGKGKLAVEDKLEMAERGLESPDRADAVLGVMSLGEQLIVHKEKFSIPDGLITRHGWDNEYSEAFAEEMGAGVGL
jgi:hypothetical protein